MPLEKRNKRKSKKDDDKKLKDILKEVVAIVVGKQAEEIADLLYNKKHVNEFLIAKKLDITINQTRNILYKISDQGLVSSIRKKDKRKGWYTYFWKIEVIKALEFLRANLLKRMDQLEHQIKSRETKIFYVCENCNIEFNEENALLRNFTCNECGRVFTQKDNTKIVREFKRNLDKLERELALVGEELGKEEEKEEKKRAKELEKDRQKMVRQRARKLKAKRVFRKKKPKKSVKRKKIVKKKVSKRKPKKKTKRKIPKGKSKKPLKKKTRRTKRIKTKIRNKKR